MKRDVISAIVPRLIGRKLLTYLVDVLAKGPGTRSQVQLIVVEHLQKCHRLI